MRSDTCPSFRAAGICSFSSSTPAASGVCHDPHFQPWLRRMGRALRRPPRHHRTPRIVCSITLSSSKSKERTIGSASMPTSCQSTCAPKGSSTRQSRHNHRAAAVGHPKIKPQITPPADHRIPPAEEFLLRHKWAQFTRRCQTGTARGRWHGICTATAGALGAIASVA
jgi:hypothetical protein